MPVYKQFYRRFLDAHAGELHFTAHSHHFWPDVTREAQLRYWDDSARLLDGKWAFLYERVIPETQRQIAEVLGSNAPQQLVFGGNTHEFVCRLLSCFEGGGRLRVLTTDGEFHSFRRQIERMAEFAWVECESVPVEPIDTFGERFVERAKKNDHELIFFSQVFFDSAYAVPELGEVMKNLAVGVAENTLIVLDAYHGFCALPTDIGPFADRIFYLAGGYKYAMAGEGVGFMHVPVGCRLRPANTGWFAAFSALEAPSSARITYANDGSRFAGATFDPSGIYRLNAALSLLQCHNLGTDAIHRYVAGLQKRFLDNLVRTDHPDLNAANLLYHKGFLHGHFFVFRLASQEKARAQVEELRHRGVYVDRRGERVRFGFGIYHDESDIDELFDRVRAVAR